MSSLKLFFPTSSSIRNIWYLRFLGVFAIIVIAVLLLVYDILFFYNFEIFGIVPSYFPWAWKVYFTDFLDVQTMFCLAVAVIEVLLAVSGALLYYYIGPNLKKSMSIQ
jgi:hypothetical protein